MTIVSSREQYLDAGLEVLGDVGYGGLKLAEVCGRLGVTTGSFYHRFSNWQQYTGELGWYWAETQTDQIVTRLWAESDPQRRLDQLTATLFTISHSTEAAMRTWASVDPTMHALLARVDKRRLDTIAAVFAAAGLDSRRARLFANWTTYLRIGYQDALIPPDLEALRWAMDRMLELLHRDRADAADG